MQLQIEMGPEFPKVVADLGLMGRAVLAACSHGLKDGVKLAANNVISNYLTGQALKRGSGLLAKSVQGWMEGNFEGVVGVKPNSPVSKYAWLLSDEEKTITAKGGALTIPIGEALTPAGVARFASVKEAESHFGKIFRPRGTNVLGYIRGKSKRSKFRALFVLVKSVFVQGSGALYDGVEESLDDITGRMQSEIDKAVER